MTFEELSKKVALEAEISVVQAKNIIRLTFDAIHASVLLRNNKCTIPSFGSFVPKKTKGGTRKAFGSEITVEPKKKIGFKPGTASKV